jgi:hypothetical protein
LFIKVDTNQAWCERLIKSHFLGGTEPIIAGQKPVRRTKSEIHIQTNERNIALVA